MISTMAVSRPSTSSSLVGSEVLAATLLVPAAAVIIVAYLLDFVGLSFRPSVMLCVAALVAAATLLVTARRALWSLADVAAFCGIVTIAFGWLMWVARPTLFPLGTGPDLTHHLQLIQYLEQHWRLVHDPGAQPYLGEMVHYTPGSHMLTALVAAWCGTRGLHVLHGLMAASAALKAGLVYLIARRMLPEDLPCQPIATIGAVLLFASQIFFLGSFMEFSFLAQVVSELFAVAMWWTLVRWDQAASASAMWLAGLFGCAVFLSWPILIGPPLLLLGVLVLLPRPVAVPLRIAHALLALLPMLAIAWLFMSGRSGMVAIAGTGGKTMWPSVGAYGRWFLTLSALGFVVSVVRRRAWTTVLLATSIVLQSSLLYWLARRHGNEPYMALKLLFFLLYPQAVAAALSIGALWQGAAGVLTAPRVQSLDARLVTAPSLAWMAVGVAVILVGRPLVSGGHPLLVARHPAASLPLERAGLWARDHLPAACIEYLVPDDETAYWLHLAVLGNPRRGARTAGNDTYELTPTLVRWLTPGGLPYAIADLRAVPSDIRRELDIIEQFDTAAVVRRQGPSRCPEGQP